MLQSAKSIVLVIRMNDEVNRTQPQPDDVAIYLKKEEGGGVHMAFWPPLSPSLMDDLEHDQEIFF